MVPSSGAAVSFTQSQSPPLFRIIGGTTHSRSLFSVSLFFFKLTSKFRTSTHSADQVRPRPLTQAINGKLGCTVIHSHMARERKTPLTRDSSYCTGHHHVELTAVNPFPMSENLISFSMDMCSQPAVRKTKGKGFAILGTRQTGTGTGTDTRNDENPLPGFGRIASHWQARGGR
jgi:hypothetical protein